ncbi:MAG: isochorismatase family protein, partial [Verrucomicrobiota bacterium]
RRAELIAGVQKLLGAAQVLQLPVVMTAQYVKGLGPVLQEITNIGGPRSVVAAPTAQTDATERVPPSADIPIEKLTFSCCGSEEFVKTVKNLHRQRLIVCGVEAHVCVQQTVIDLLQHYIVYVAADAIASRKDTDATVAIQRMHDCGAVITTVESAVFEMLQVAGTDQFKACLPLFK